MLRYYAIATAIVLSIAVLVTAWANRDLIRIKISGGKGNISPRPAPTADLRGGNSRPFRGDAPWALSALPDCLRQREESRGGIAYVRAHLPPGLTPISPPATLRFGSCTISVLDGEAYVRRGADLFHIPQHAEFFTGSGVLVLLHTNGVGADLRIYEPATVRE